MGLRKFQILKNGVVWQFLTIFLESLALWHDVTAISKEINSEIKSVEFFEIEYFHIEDNWIPKRGVNLPK